MGNEKMTQVGKHFLQFFLPVIYWQKVIAIIYKELLEFIFKKTVQWGEKSKDHQKEMQVTNAHYICSTILVIRDLQIKITRTWHLMPTGLTKTTTKELTKTVSVRKK